VRRRRRSTTGKPVRSFPAPPASMRPHTALSEAASLALLRRQISLIEIPRQRSSAEAQPDHDGREGIVEGARPHHPGHEEAESDCDQTADHSHELRTASFSAHVVASLAHRELEPQGGRAFSGPIGFRAAHFLRQGWARWGAADNARAGHVEVGEVLGLGLGRHRGFPPGICLGRPLPSQTTCASVEHSSRARNSSSSPLRAGARAN
jgi:hypothetical protein